jgi:hypothetical protein
MKLWGWLFVAGLMVVASACASSSGATVREVPPEELPMPASQQTAAQPVAQPPAMTQALPMQGGDEWVGTYVCAQGQTDLTVHVDSVLGDGTISAVFDFSHTPSGAAGSFRLHGSIDSSGNVRLRAGAWMQRPSGYETVGMSGRIRADAFTGRIDNPSCGGFTLRRQ